MQYRPEIDGMRAIAVVSVVVFHAFAALAPGGYVGVDVFFVISGYLITTILINDLKQQRFSIINFYERRARRILPALVVVIFLTLIASLFLLPIAETIEVFESAFATVLFLANFRFWLKTDYFATAAEERPLLHMWSLAVEEQFYLVFPILLWLIWRGRKNALLWVFFGLAALSLVAAEVTVRLAPTANFFLPFGRMWELLAGSIAAVIGVRQFDGIKSQLLSGLGLLLIIVPIFAYDKFTPGPGLWTIAPVLGAVLIILFAVKGTIAARLLANRLMVGMGLISYSVYLYHQPLLAFARVNLPPDLHGPGWFLCVGLLSVPLGYLSWRLVEGPFRKGFTRGMIFALSGVSIGLIAAVSLIFATQPNTVRGVYQATLSEEGQANFATLQSLSDLSLSDLDRQNPCHIRSSYADAEFEAKYADCLAQHGPGIIVLGGSHSADLQGALVAASDHPFIAALSLGFCRPHKSLIGPPPHECHYEGAMDFVTQNSTDVALVIYHQAFFPLFDSYRNVRSTDGFHPELIDEAVTYLEALNAHVPVSMVGPRRILGIDPRRLNPRQDIALQIGNYAHSGTRAAEDLADTRFAEMLAETRIEYISLLDLIDLQLPRDAMREGVLLYHDSNHWNAEGEAVFGARIKQAFQNRTDGQMAHTLFGGIQ